MIDSSRKIFDLESQIKILKSSLNDSQYLSNIGSWNWNVNTNEVTWSINMYRIMGLKPNELAPSYELALQHVHELDKEKYERTLSSAIENKTFYYLENRITKKDNSVISVISRGNCVHDEKENLIQMYGTVQDISSQKRLEKVTQEKIRAEEAEKVRSMFLSIISHDLKHPFLILKNYSKFLIDSMHLGKTNKAIEYAQIINNTSVQTFKIIGNLLEWTRANSNKLIYKPVKLNLKEFIDKISKPFSIVIRKKNLAISISESSNLNLFADKNVLAIIFSNLIENAIKFSNQNGQITISVWFKKDQIVFSVADEGIGIDLEYQEEVLATNYLVSTLGTDGELGTGIGLKLCKTLIEKHNGTFWLESKIGKGTTCFFTLPNP